MARTHGRSARGERLRMGVPHGHRKTSTLVAGLRLGGMVAPMVLDGPINGDWFEAYARQVLAPTLHTCRHSNLTVRISRDRQVGTCATFGAGSTAPPSTALINPCFE
jgi:hypothetical protein